MCVCVCAYVYVCVCTCVKQVDHFHAKVVLTMVRSLSIT